jgi:DNA-binding MarR family transcriptional regulator
MRRKISPRDRRARELYLTLEGERVYEGVTPIVRNLQVRIIEGLDVKERKIFLKLLGKAVATAGEKNRAS